MQIILMCVCLLSTVELPRPNLRETIILFCCTGDGYTTLNLNYVINIFPSVVQTFLINIRMSGGVIPVSLFCCIYSATHVLVYYEICPDHNINRTNFNKILRKCSQHYGNTAVVFKAEIAQCFVDSIIVCLLTAS